MREENTGKVARTQAHKERKMLRRIRGLKNKKYPENKYQVLEVGGLKVIKRVAGTRPHKKSKKAR